MKNLIFFLFLLLGIKVFSQITLDFQTSSPYTCFKLSDSETKFYDGSEINSSHQFLLYNLDGSLFKSVQIPVDPNDNVVCILWISRTLFDNDPSNIEYMACFGADSSSNLYSQRKTKIIREDGTILLNEMNANCYFTILNFPISWVPIIYATESGTKLLLDYYWATGSYYQSKIFNLPGNIPAGVQDNPKGFDNVLSLYPNPNTGLFFIKFDSNHHGESAVELYSNNGKLINTYKSASNPVQINAIGLSDGIYFVNSFYKGKNSNAKVIIQK
jgi:hypothetical protein